MSAADRVATLFYLPHVIGHQALDFPEDVRTPLLTVTSLAQLFVIATRGNRSYNKREWKELFERGWVVCFGALERLYQLSFDKKYAKKLKLHRSNPEKNAAPNEFTKKSR